MNRRSSRDAIMAGLAVTIVAFVLFTIGCGLTALLS